MTDRSRCAVGPVAEAVIKTDETVNASRADSRHQLAVAQERRRCEMGWQYALVGSGHAAPAFGSVSGTITEGWGDVKQVHRRGFGRCDQRSCAAGVWLPVTARVKPTRYSAV